MSNQPLNFHTLDIVSYCAREPRTAPSGSNCVEIMMEEVSRRYLCETSLANAISILGNPREEMADLSHIDLILSFSRSP